MNDILISDGKVLAHFIKYSNFELLKYLYQNIPYGECNSISAGFYDALGVYAVYSCQ